MARALVVGGGFAGCAAALVLVRKGHSVTLVERAPFLGGGCRTQLYGGHPYTFGPRYFVTKDEAVFAFVDRLVPLRRIPDQELLSFVESDPGFYSYPIHDADIDAMPDREKIRRELSARDRGAPSEDLEAYWINAIGPTLYEKFIEAYTKKMWGLESNRELEAGSTWPVDAEPIRSGPRAAWTDSMTAFPEGLAGYDPFFTRAVEGVEVLLGAAIDAFDVEQRRVKLGGDWRKFDLMVSTISPEILLGNAFGPLRWMGRELLKLVLPVRFAFPPNVYCVYYPNAEPFTRVVEYKKFFRNESESTLIAAEIPSTKNRIFPFPRTRERSQAQRYLDALPDRVWSIGRAGSYDYAIDIAASIKQAIEIGASI